MSMDKKEQHKGKEEKYVYQSYTEYSPLTGLYYNKAFLRHVEEYLTQVEQESYCMVAMDIEHFKVFNKVFGREQGDQLLVGIANTINEFRKNHGGIVGYLGGDNFGILMPYDEQAIDLLYNEVVAIIRKWSDTLGFLPALGICPIEDCTIPAVTIYDRATLALSRVIGNYLKRTCVYTSDMEEQVENEVALLTAIQEGLVKGEFTFYVQPQCDIATGKIVGGEALIRWKHGAKGLISPGVFIPVLEKNGFIADVDKYIWEKVCQWLRSLIDKGYKPVPISINISRMDIFAMDVPALLNSLVDKYNLPARLLKAEITESAYIESNEKLVKAIKELREAEFLVMMDDFGSGYSSLNMLKDVSVDVLKMDMRFLDISEQEEEKGIGILESVVNMAKQMRLPIIAEGVETQKQENILLQMGCYYSQGYYYYKPMPAEDFEQLISDEKNLDWNGLWCRQKEALRLREFLDGNLFTDVMLNNILGPSAFYDMYENWIEIIRVNNQYCQLAGVSPTKETPYGRRFWNHVRDDDRQLLVSIFAQAVANPSVGAEGYIHYVRDDSVVLWVLIKVFFLREREGHKIFYGSLTDITALEEKKRVDGIMETEVADLTDKQMQRIDKYYGDLPCGFGVAKVILNDSGKPDDYEVVYVNGVLSRVCGRDKERLKYLMRKLFADRQDELLNKAYKAAYEGEVRELNVYSPISYRYFKYTFYQYQQGYVNFIIQDVTQERIYEKALNNTLSAYREVYFLNLNENYWRMIYPDEHHLIESGNYEESINRHFCIGKILPYDEENIRRFLSLANLRKALINQDVVEYKYRRSVQGLGEEWCLTSVKVCERKNGVPQTALLTIRSIEEMMRRKEEKKHDIRAGMLSGMSDGFFVYNAGEDEEIRYVNPTVLEIFGCDTEEEFRELSGNTFSGMVHPEDCDRIQWEIQEQVKNSDAAMDFIYYRIIRKDGEVRWIDDCGHLENPNSDGSNQLFYVFISDVTDKLSEEQKERLLKRNRNFSQIIAHNMREQQKKED